MNFMFNSNYSLEYNRYEDSPFSCADSLIRGCLRGINEEQLNVGLKEMRKQFGMYSIYNRDILPTALYIMSAILFQSNNKQCLDILSGYIEKEMDNDVGQLNQLFDINSCSRITLMFLLTLFLLRKTDDELCRRIIDRWVAVQDSEGRRRLFEEDRLSRLDFIVNPMYPIMITENYELIGYFLEKCAQAKGMTTAEMVKTMHLEGYVESAVQNRQKDFLQLLYDYGFDLSDNLEALTFIYSKQEHFDYISQVWDVQREIAPNEESQENGGERRICIRRKNQLAFLWKMCRNYGKAGCDELFRNNPLIDTIDEEDIASITSMHCAAEFADCPDLDNADTHNGINYSVNIVALLDRYLAQDVTIIAYRGSIDALLPFLPSKNVTFDMRNCGKDSDYFGLQIFTVANMKFLLKRADILFNTDELTAFHRQLLNQNSAPLTKLMIQKGAFSEANIDAAIAYLVECRYYNCLSELNKLYYKEEV